MTRNFLDGRLPMFLGFDFFQRCDEDEVVKVHAPLTGRYANEAACRYNKFDKRKRRRQETNKLRCLRRAKGARR